MNPKNIIKWIGTVTTVASAIVISASPTLSQHSWAFTGYIIGAAVWLYTGIRTRDYPLASLNAFYLLINVFAIYVRL